MAENIIRLMHAPPVHGHNCEPRPRLRLPVGETQTPRHDTDDRIGLPVQPHVLTDDVGATAETTLPQSLSEDDDIGVPCPASLSRNVRPTRARARSTRIRLGVTPQTRNRSGSPSEASVIGRPLSHPPISSIVSGRSRQARYAPLEIVQGTRPPRPPRVS